MRSDRRNKQMKYAEEVRNWWVGKGCVQHSNNLRDFVREHLLLAWNRGYRAAQRDAKNKGRKK